MAILLMKTSFNPSLALGVAWLKARTKRTLEAVA
jgi:hypothetical protein